MNDHELLKLAAKAAGIELVELDECQDVLSDGTAWNPLTDDGDALRLAVKLGIDVDQSGQIGVDSEPYTAVVCHWRYRRKESSIDLWTSIGQKHEGDPYAATRRAIVRAAAEIGKAMP